MEIQDPRSEHIVAPPAQRAVTHEPPRPPQPPQPEKGAIGIAFLVWLLGGGLGLAVLVFVLLKIF